MRTMITDSSKQTISLFLIITLLFGLKAQSSAQQTSLIANPFGRQTMTLNGNWQIIIDPSETGYYDYRYLPRSDGYFKNEKPANPSALIEYDFDFSQHLNVP